MKLIGTYNPPSNDDMKSCDFLRTHVGKSQDQALIVREASELLYGKVRWEVLLGSVSLPRMTNRVAQDADGWFHYEMTDGYTLDHYGVEVPGSRYPGEPVMRWRNGSMPQKAWWRFWE